jgi:hypothetical protein
MSAEGIRAGAAYVEIYGDSSRLGRDLDSSQATLAKWAQKIAGGAGVGILAREIGAAMSGVAAALRSDWVEVQEAIGDVPILGGAAIALANGFDDLVLHIREGMKRMREEAQKEFKYTQNVLAAAQKEMAIKMQIAMIGADPYSLKVMQINEKARQEVEAEKKRAADAGGMTPANLGVIARIEERRQKEVAEATGEHTKAAGDARLNRIVAEQERASQAARAWEDTLFGLTQELARARGATEALALEEATAKRNLAKELAAGTITSDQYRARLSELAQIYDELALAEEGRKQDAERAANAADAEAARVQIERAGTEWANDQENRTLDEIKRQADAAGQAAASLAEQTMTPEERGQALAEKYADMLAAGDITAETYQRAVRAAAEAAAGAAEDVTGDGAGSKIAPSTSRGMFGATNAWMMGASGVQERTAVAVEKVAKNTEKTAELLRKWGVATFD